MIVVPAEEWSRTSEGNSLGNHTSVLRDEEDGIALTRDSRFFLFWAPGTRVYIVFVFIQERLDLAHLCVAGPFSILSFRL